MKALRISYLILIVLGLITLAWNYIVIQPKLAVAMEYDSMVATMAYSHYRELSDMLGLAGTCLAGIGAILAAIAYFKGKQSIHLVFAIAGVVVAVAAFFVSFGRVV